MLYGEQIVGEQEWNYDGQLEGCCVSFRMK